MRILVVTNLFPPAVYGGYEIACAQAARGLANLGHDVHVLTAQPGIASTPEAAPGHPTVERSLALAQVFDPDQILTHPTVVIQSLEARSEWIDSHNVGVLVDALDRLRPDVVYLWNLVGLGGLGLVAALRTMHVPWVWQLGDRLPFQLCSQRGEVVPELVRIFERLDTGRWLSVSNQLRMEIEGYGIEFASPVTTIPWVDVTDAPVSIPAPLEGRPLRLAFAGQVAVHKGADLAIDAVGELHRLGVEVTLDVWGEVIDLSLPGRAAARGVASSVTFHGPKPHPEVLAGIASCDLFLFPTWPREPFGMVAAEAAAVGTPPVLSESGVAEWLVDGEHAIKIPRTVAGIVDGVRRVAGGHIDLQRLARQAASRIRTDLTLERALPVVEGELAAAARSFRPSRRRSERTYHLGLLADRLITALVEERFADE